MCWGISLRIDIEFVKKALPEIRGESKQLDYDCRYFENLQTITFHVCLVYNLGGYVNMSDGKYRYKRYQSWNLPSLRHEGLLQQSLF